MFKPGTARRPLLTRSSACHGKKRIEDEDEFEDDYDWPNPIIVIVLELVLVLGLPDKTALNTHYHHPNTRRPGWVSDKNGPWPNSFSRSDPGRYSFL